MGKKILLADDSITIQKVIELTFSDEDFEVVTVGNGRLAIEKVQEARPDVVLCDIIMPEKDGYEVCEFIKKSPTLSHVPVLLLTGAFEPFDQERAARAGCDGFLAKPFEPQTLIAKVKDLLSQAVARPPAAVAAPAPAPAPAPQPAFSAPAPPPTPPPPVSFTPAPPPAPPTTFTPPPVTFTPPPVTFAPPPVAFTPTAGSAYTPPATAGAPPIPISFEATLPEEPPAPPDAMSEPAMTYVSEESPAEEAPLGFADVMDTVPAPAETFDEPELEPVAFAATVDETAGDESLLDVSPDERAALEPPPPQLPPEPTDSSSTVMFQAGSALPWTPPALEEPVEEAVEEPVQSALGEAMFEEVFEEDLSAVPPLQAATPPAPVPLVAEAPLEEPALEVPEPEPASAAAVPEEAEASLSDALAAEAAPPVSVSEAAEVAVPVDQVAQIAQRVVGQISEKVIREIAWEVIPDLAEAMIRKEIERLKAELQQS